MIGRMLARAGYLAERPARTDQGSAFRSREFSVICIELGIEHCIGCRSATKQRGSFSPRHVSGLDLPELRSTEPKPWQASSTTMAGMARTVASRNVHQIQLVKTQPLDESPPRRSIHSHLGTCSRRN